MLSEYNFAPKLLHNNVMCLVIVFRKRSHGRAAGVAKARRFQSYIKYIKRTAHMCEVPPNTPRPDDTHFRISHHIVADGARGI